MINQQLALTVVLSMLCIVFLSGCDLPRRNTGRYVKPSAVDGGSEDEAILAIEAVDGTCFRYQELKSLLVPRGSYWLEPVEGNPVVAVCLDDCQMPDQLLAEVAKLKHLQSLCIQRTGIGRNVAPLNDQHAAQISEMDSLRELRLENTNITASGILDLAKLKLEHLNFNSNPINDPGIKAIATIDTLKELHLHGSLGTDAGYAQLADLKDLRFLSVGSPRLSDAGLKAWSTMKALEELTINGSNVSGVGFEPFDDSGIRILKLDYCKVSPAGLGSVSRLSEVEELSFFNSSMTDAGLESLAEMPKLQTLRLYGSSVTEAGLRKLIPSRSLMSVDVTECKITRTECERFNQESYRCRAMIIED